ncbi:MAG: alanyl-tRNA editing protein [Myxococcales bacterium]|nr:alanyl-tRNA editing protein [Myxococcales bacterium]MCB9579192.1 alanyl-tRNA editing protein [Polyangiaceae bacterium]
MATARLYFEDPWLVEFEAYVVAHHAIDGDTWLELDRSAFYPEGGGQLPDRGHIGDAEVADVQVRGDVVLHRASGALPEVGTRVLGRLDRARRRVHMALHTGQHVLSRALLEVAQAETVSSRLGDTTSTIDVDRPNLSDDLLGKAEALANSVVDDDVVVRARFVTPDELAGLSLRRAPKQTDNVRVVSVAGFDDTPCGGTHCTRSAQIGLVSITGSERYKGGTRIVFSAGARAREELSRNAAELRRLAKALTCATADVGAQLDKLRDQLDAARQEHGATRTLLAREIARGASGSPAVIVLAEGGAELARAVAARVTESPEASVVVAAETPDGTSVVVARGSAAAFDSGAFLKRLAAATGGRGGGRPERAEGRLPLGVDVARAVQELG